MVHSLPPPSLPPYGLPPCLLYFHILSVFFSSLSLGLTKDGGGSANAESLEEVLNILAEEGSDWIYGFFTFLYDVVSSPVERGEEEEKGAGEDDKGVTLDRQNQ